MNKAYLQTVLQRPIAFHRVFVPLGGVTGALFLSQLLYWSDRGSEGNGWIYKTQAEWTDETGLSRREQETARRQLREAGVIEECYKGLPAKLFYRINFDALSDYLERQVKVAEKRASKDGGNVHPVCTKAPTKSGGKRQSTNTETTTEITAVAAAHDSTSVSEIKTAAAADSVESKIEAAKQLGAVVQNTEDQLAIADLINEFGLEQVTEAIRSVRTIDHRRAYASNLRKKLTSVVAVQKSEALHKHVSTVAIDQSVKTKGDNLLADIARKRMARSSTKDSK